MHLMVHLQRLSAHNSKRCILEPGCIAFYTYVLMSKIIYSRAGRPRTYGASPVERESKYVEEIPRRYALSG